MAARTISTTDTLEDLRLQFNALSENDFGDIATLDPSLSATSVIGAVNELSAAVTASSGFFLEDSSSTQQQIAPGQTLHVDGSTNVNAVVSATDTLTISLTNNLTLSGTSHTFGSLAISGTNISQNTGNNVGIGSKFTIGGTDGTYIENSDNFIRFGDSNLVTNGYIYTRSSTGLVFEGSTEDDFECVINAIDPTQDNTINFPNVSGTVVTTGDTGSVATGMIDDDAVTEAKIADDAVGQDQLKSVVNLQIINSSGVTLKSLFGAGA